MSYADGLQGRPVGGYQGGAIFKPVKIVVVGDAGIGKTSLLTTYVSRVFPLDYVPPVLDQYTASVMINGQPVIIGLHDTMGEPAYDRLRPLCYPDTDVFVLCFSLTDGPSFENIVSKWYPEISQYPKDGTKVPIILVGTKLDLRDDEPTIAMLGNSSLVRITTMQGCKRQQDIGAIKYIECSSLRNKGVKTVFDEAIRVAMKPTNKADLESACVIL